MLQLGVLIDAKVSLLLYFRSKYVFKILVLIAKPQYTDVGIRGWFP